LLRIREMKDHGTASSPFVNFTFESVSGPTQGQKFTDSFFLSEKAITRLECLVHRCGIDVPVKTRADIFSLKLFVEMIQKRVWALLKEETRNNVTSIRTDGWQFRAETDPPEESEGSFIDYKAQEEWEIAMEGL
jgi:hypothetical protein